VAVTTPMGAKRGRGRSSFIDSVLHSIDDFYANVMQNLKSWTAAPPRLRQAEAEEVATEQRQAPALVSTALSSQDGAAPAGPVDGAGGPDQDLASDDTPLLVHGPQEVGGP
jgi:hypothetical protein